MTAIPSDKLVWVIIKPVDEPKKLKKLAKQLEGPIRKAVRLSNDRLSDRTSLAIPAGPTNRCSKCWCHQPRDRISRATSSADFFSEAAFSAILRHSSRSRRCAFRIASAIF